MMFRVFALASLMITFVIAGIGCSKNESSAPAAAAAGYYVGTNGTCYATGTNTQVACPNGGFTTNSLGQCIQTATGTVYPSTYCTGTTGSVVCTGQYCQVNAGYTGGYACGYCSGVGSICSGRQLYPYPYQPGTSQPVTCQ